VPERDIDPRRLLWVGPLTILSSIAAVLVVRAVVFAFVAGASVRPFRLYRRIAFAALLISFIPDLLLPGRFQNATWPLVGVLMIMHAAAWAVTVTMLTTLTAARDDDAASGRP
jgi:hypothetical protein